MLGTLAPSERDIILRHWIEALQDMEASAAQWKSKMDSKLVLRFPGVKPIDTEVFMQSLLRKQAVVTLEINLWDFVRGFKGDVESVKCPIA